ncbi:MgtC/SapB family protein [Curtobacterium sp. 9128]|uniref:MgtC/SapB family protein n=1 Tax=Curtobacterium sp. 9128 TaxID=1793722 RepID=UPI0011A81F63|nr:MgtC/SapB family protein [Curtobacterium sp. 9128]
MTPALVSPFAGQGWVQIGEVLLAFALASSIGLERQMRAKSAGLRTQAIVGTAAALMLLVSKYGFSDVLGDHVVLDPSRVAAQIVSGVGFLGAGLILTRRGAVRGLTTAAAVWETAAVGMAAGAGLWLLALVVTALHFVIVFGYTAVLHRLDRRSHGAVSLEIAYDAHRGVLPQILTQITSAGWSVTSLTQLERPDPDLTAVRLELTGSTDTGALYGRIADLEDVRGITPVTGDELE